MAKQTTYKKGDRIRVLEDIGIDGNYTIPTGEVVKVAGTVMHGYSEYVVVVMQGSLLGVAPLYKFQRYPAQ